MPDGQIGVGKLFLDNFPGALLVARVQKRKQKTDGDRLDPLGLHHPHRLTHLVLVERAEHLAVRGNDPLADRTPIASPHQGVLLPRHVLVQAEGQGAFMAGDVQNVAVALGRQHADLGAVVFQHDIGGDRCAVEQVVKAGRLNPGPLAHGVQSQQGGFGRVGRGTGQLMDHYLALVFVHIHQVGEGSADINANTFHAQPSFSRSCGSPQS